jgi:tetratricopeptide (TPR) repeat protein
MDLHRWRLVKDIFQNAIARSAEERPSFLANACSADAELREQVEQLVRAHERAADFLERPAYANPARILSLHSTLATVVRQFSTYQVGSAFAGNERFTIIRRLGAGGMGVVYEAHDRVRNEIVALKTLRRASAADMYRLKQEFRALADLAHPNVVCLYELFVAPDTCFFTMERVNGVNVLEYVRGEPAGMAAAATGPADADRVRHVLRQIVAALLDLHGKGKLHRDIKPSNVMVTAEGRVVILDFGLISDIRSQFESDDRVAGTPAYLAPEQHRGEASSEASDWYSLGVTLYEALTGRLPFTGSPHVLRARKNETEAAAPAQVEPAVPADLNGICVGFLRRDPRHRLAGHEALALLATSPVSPRDPPRAVRRQARPPFVGRRRELGLLHDAFADARSGRTAALYIHGPSGIGKTALVQRFLDEVAADHGEVVVLRGRCYEHESVPYKALDGVIDSLSQYLGSLPRARAETLVPRDVRPLSRLFPVMLQVDAIASASTHGPESPDLLALRRRAFAALRDLLARLAGDRPLIVYIDDLQWADADSAQLLLKPPQAPPLLMLASFRAEEIAAQPFLQTLLDRARAGESAALPLEPMDELEACTLIASCVPAKPLSQAETLELARDAGGNPFLLEQLADHVAASETWPHRPATFAEMLDMRVCALSDDARLFLEILAVCGRPMAPRLVCEAAGIDGDERPLVARLRSDRLLRSSGSAQRVEMYHDRIRETLASRVSPEDERRIHSLMARTLLARQEVDPETLYVHYRGAGQYEPASAQAALAAKKAHEALAFDRAAMFYRSALELAPDSPIRFEWKEQLADALAHGGRPAEAADIYLEAALGADATRRIELQRRAAEQLLIGGHIDRGLETIRKVLAETGARLPSSRRRALVSLMLRRAQLRWRGMGFAARGVDQIPAQDLLRIDAYWSVTTGLLLVDPFRAAEFHTRHLLLALDAGDPYRIVRGLSTEAGLSAVSASPSRRRTAALIERARTMAEGVGHPFAIASATLAEGTAACLQGQWRKAAGLCDRALGMLRDRCVGVTWELNCAQNFLLAALMYQGRLQEVSRRHPLLLADAREHGNLYIETELGARMTYVWLAADDPDEGQRQADDIMERWSHQAFDRQRYSYLLARIQIELYRDRAEPAWQLIADNWAAVEESRLLRVQFFRIEASYARARCALLMAAHGRDPRRFLSLARREVRRLERAHMPWSAPLALLVSAAVTYLEGNSNLAEDLLARAAAGFDLADMHLHAAAARRRLGALLGGERGRALTRQADDWMAGEDIRNAARFTRLIAPGMPDSDG